MKKRIARFSVVQNAKLTAVLYLILSVPLVLVLALVSAFSPGASPVRGVVLILLPVAYAVGGFVFAALAALVYNLAARLVGGLEYTTVDADPRD